MGEEGPSLLLGFSFLLLQLLIVELQDSVLDAAVTFLVIIVEIVALVLHGLGFDLVLGFGLICILLQGCYLPLGCHLWLLHNTIVIIIIKHEKHFLL